MRGSPQTADGVRSTPIPAYWNPCLDRHFFTAPPTRARLDSPVDLSYDFKFLLFFLEIKNVFLNLPEIDL